MERRAITNADLGLGDIPSGSIGDEVLDYFALSFDGYAVWGQQRCGRMANDWKATWRGTGQIPDTITELRGCLFFEQRRRNHMSPDYDDDQFEYERLLLGRLRDKLAQGEIDDEGATVEAWMSEHPDAGAWDRESVRTILAEVVKEATGAIPEAIAEREGTYGLEKDLRDGIATALRSRDELALTEAKIGVPEWDPRLGGFDLAVVSSTGEVAVAETKWADGNLWESIWDILKLASAATMPRTCGAFAIYGAPEKHWEKPVATAELFLGGWHKTHALIAAYPEKWKKLLQGSTAWPENVQLDFGVEPIGSFDTEVSDISWQVRVVEVSPGGAWTWLENGWPPEVHPPA